MMVLAGVMKASITWVWCSVQISSLRKLWLCQELVRSTIQRVSACEGVLLVEVCLLQPRMASRLRVLL